MRKRIFNLGQLLVDELGLDPGVDTLSRWMAHYIAEQMALAESADGEQKAELEQKCFDLILALWERRVYFPYNSRPFENFELIFKVIERLNPEQQDWRFYAPNSDVQKALENAEDSELREWLEVAIRIDNAARIFVEDALHNAAQHATDDKVLAFLENSPDESEDADVMSRILRIVYDEEDEVSPQQLARQRIESRLEQMDAFIEYGQRMRAEYVCQLEELQLDEGLVDEDKQSFVTAH